MSKIKHTPKTKLNFMKTLITILLLTSTLVSFGQDYSINDNDLKRRGKEAKNKIVIGAGLIAASVLIKNDKVNESGRLDYAAGAVAGIGGAMTTTGIIESIEIGKEKRARRKAKKD